MSRLAWSWEDFYAQFPDRRPGAVPAAARAPDPAPQPQPQPPPPPPLDPRPACLPAEPGREARMTRARELLAMGVEGAMVRRCVRLAADDLAELGLAGGA